MNSVLGLTQFAKASEYLIAVAFFLAFLAFWQFMAHRGRAMWVRVVPPLLLSLLVAAAAYVFLDTSLARPPPDRVLEVPLLRSSLLASMYGPAHFDHPKHQAIPEGCAFCHHHGEAPAPLCKSCHNDAEPSRDPEVPSQTRIYHIRCIGCHRENRVGPTDCIGCHIKAAVPPLSINHPLTGAGNCLSCHAAHIPGVPSLPQDHHDATNGVCQLCHQPRVDPTALARRKMPHGTDGFSACLLCHGEGIGKATRVPPNHAGRTNETCLICHIPPEKTA